MTSEHDTRTRTVVSWLREDAHENAERVLLSALNEVDTTSQRRPAWPARRIPDMNGYAKILAGAAAVVVVAVAGFMFLPRATGPGAQPTPTAAPSASVARLPGSGAIEPGTYRMGGDASIVLTIPPGWESKSSEIRKHLDQPGELSFFVDASDKIAVYADACATVDTPPPAGPTADDLLTALRAQANVVVAEPVTVRMGGRDVMRVDVSTPAGLDLATCTEGIYRNWESSESGYLATNEPKTATIYLAQTGAGRIVFWFEHAPDASAADVAELDAMVESMVIEPAP